MHDHNPSPLTYLAAIAASTAVAYLIARREGGLVRMTLAEAAGRRRLRAVHLGDQLAAEVESKVERALVEGFAIGYQARRAEEWGQP